MEPFSSGHSLANTFLKDVDSVDNCYVPLFDIALTWHQVIIVSEKHCSLEVSIKCILQSVDFSGFLNFFYFLAKVICLNLRSSALGRSDKWGRIKPD